MVTLTIDGQETTVPEGTTILQAAQGVGVKIPTLCYNSHLKPYGGCRLCIVEVGSPRTGPARRIVASCAYPVEEGLTVETNTDRVRKNRRFVFQLLLAGSDSRRSPEFLALAEQFGVDPERAERGDRVGKYLLSKATHEDTTRCIKCGLCVRVCTEFVGRSATSFEGRGSEKRVGTPFGKVSKTCIGCGACAYLCPTKTIKIEPAEEGEE